MKPNTINDYFDQIRARFGVKGTMIYNGKSELRLTVAGWPYVRITADNDNEAKP